MAGKKATENGKKAAGNARKADAAAQKNAAKDAQLAAADDEKWDKGSKNNSKKYVLSVSIAFTHSERSSTHTPHRLPLTAGLSHDS